MRRLNSAVFVCVVGLAVLFSEFCCTSHRLTFPEKNDILHFQQNTSCISLRSGPIFVTVNGKRYTTADGSLQLQGGEEEIGVDVLGSYQQKMVVYKLYGLRVHFQEIERRYDDYPDMSVFIQRFPDGIANSSVNDSDVTSTGYPSIILEDFLVPVGFLSYGGIMFGDTEKKLGKWGKNAKINSGLNGGPLVIFDGSDNAVVISPFSQFMVGSVWQDTATSTVNWGIIGSMSSIPAGFEYATVMYCSNKGINQAMAGWGSVLRKYYNRHQSFRYSDYTNNYLSYWTDNGGYYYYVTEPNKTYEQTILDVKTYADSKNIPFRSIEYDSWWYPKGPGRGVVEWVSMPSIFPHGMQYLWNKTGWLVTGHNRWWSSKTTYAKDNGGKYDFIVEKSNGKSIPVDPQFWDDLMKSSRTWGLVTYEQDWMNVQFNQMDVTRTDITLGRNWLLQMGRGAANNGITIQYCMSPSRHSMQALEIPVVSQARVSADYSPGGEQWRIGITSMFAEAMGIAPYKDNFWTTASQPGSIYKHTEPYTALNVLVATLSTGPVAACDMIGGTNVSLLMKCCNSDGLILKPSKPALAINSQIKEAALLNGHGPAGELWTTYSQIGPYIFGIVLAADLQKTYDLGPTDAFGKQFPESMYYSSIMGVPSALRRFSDDRKVTLNGCTKTDFCLFYTTSVIRVSSEVYLLGETAKWVPMSVQRVSRIDANSDDVIVHLKGAAQEKVTFWSVVDGKQRPTSCVISTDGTVAIGIISNTCLPFKSSF